MKEASYRSDVVGAFSQYVRNMERLTPTQWTLIHSFTPSGKTFYCVAAEILLDLHCGAEIHEAGD